MATAALIFPHGINLQTLNFLRSAAAKDIKFLCVRENYVSNILLASEFFSFRQQSL